MGKLAIASDHGGFQLKAAIVKALTSWGIDHEDLGTNDTSSCDYPDYAHLVARGIKQGRYDRGILICGTGIGISIAANRHEGIRAALVTDTFSARMSRAHNNSNVLCMGGRVVGEGLALDLVKIWLDTQVEDDPRHVRRVAKIEPKGGE
jgi:ribose 5-phosphate isomerase B